MNPLVAFQHIEQIYEVVGTWEVLIGNQKIGVKVKQNILGKQYVYETSHYYQGVGQIGPYVSSHNGFLTIDEALHYAGNQLTLHYNPTDQAAKWVFH